MESFNDTMPSRLSASHGGALPYGSIVRQSKSSPAPSMAEDFQYDDDLNAHDTGQSSGGRKIRVLELLPESTEEGLISCKLKCVELSNTHTAVSYTWGPENPQYTILVNGKLIKIRQNLYQFLDIARKRHHSTPLWVDAVCINQHSVAERNQQVTHMAEIFTRAKLLLVWLGQGNLRWRARYYQQIR